MKKLFLLFLPFLFSCSSDDDEIKGLNVDFSKFSEIEEEDREYFSDLQQNVSFLGLATRTEGQELLFRKIYGECGEQEIVNCFDLENLDPESGFSTCNGFYGSHCYNFLVIIRDGQTEVINEIEEYKSLVGEIDKVGEALFILLSENYWAETNNIQLGAYRIVDGGFEIIATKLISDCAPILVHRYHLKVSHNGKITVLAEEEYSRDENMCI